jgi:hypothetical protein
MTFYIASLDEVKVSLGIADTSDDELLRIMLDTLQGRLATHCGRNFLYESARTEIHNGGGRAIFLRNWPVDAVSSVAIDAEQDFDAAANQLAATDYLVGKRRGLLYYGTGAVAWPEGRENIRVVYAGGLLKADGSAAPGAETAEIATLRRALLMQAGFEWRNREQLGLAQVSQGGVSVQQGAQVPLALAGQTLLPEVETTLRPLVRTV